MSAHAENMLERPIALSSTVFEDAINSLRDSLTCQICLKLLYEPFTTSCGHTYCYECLNQWFAGSGNGHQKTCPDCRARIRQQPAPAFLVRQMVEVLCKRDELLPDGESMQEHMEMRQEMVSLVERHKEDKSSGGGLFEGRFQTGNVPNAIRDEHDGIWRCPMCHAELVDGLCLTCDLAFDDAGQPMLEDLIWDDASSSYTSGTTGSVEWRLTPTHARLMSLADISAVEDGWFSSDGEEETDLSDAEELSDLIDDRPVSESETDRASAASDSDGLSDDTVQYGRRSRNSPANLTSRGDDLSSRSHSSQAARGLHVRQISGSPAFSSVDERSADDSEASSAVEPNQDTDLSRLAYQQYDDYNEDSDEDSEPSGYNMAGTGPFSDDGSEMEDDYAPRNSITRKRNRAVIDDDDSDGGYHEEFAELSRPRQRQRLQVVSSSEPSDPELSDASTTRPNSSHMPALQSSSTSRPASSATASLAPMRSDRVSDDSADSGDESDEEPIQAAARSRRIHGSSRTAGHGTVSHSNGERKHMHGRLGSGLQTTRHALASRAGNRL